MLINLPKKKNKRKIPGREFVGDGAGGAGSGVYDLPSGDELDTVYDSDADTMRCKRIELSFIRILSPRETIYQYISRARIKIRKDSLSLPFRFYSVKFSFHFAIMLEQELNAESVKFIAVLFRVWLNICF